MIAAIRARGGQVVTFRTISDRPIYWTDSKGLTHLCEGADIHRSVRILWTLCERDVPANAGFLPGDDDRVRCPKCLARETSRFRAEGES